MVDPSMNEFVNTGLVRLRKPTSTKAGSDDETRCQQRNPREASPAANRASQTTVTRRAGSCDRASEAIGPHIPASVVGLGRYTRRRADDRTIAVQKQSGTGAGASRIARNLGHANAIGCGSIAPTSIVATARRAHGRGQATDAAEGGLIEEE